MSMAIDVVVVDDLELNRRMLIRGFANKYPECRIHEAVSADDVLLLLGRISCDVVITDFNMPPGMNGGCLAREIRHRGFSGLILLWSSDPREYLEEYLGDQNLAPIDCVPKGVQVEVFGAHILSHRLKPTG